MTPIRLTAMYDATWPTAAAQLMKAGYSRYQALWALGLIDEQGRLLPRDEQPKSNLPLRR
jgi:hypothetical protein